MPNASATKANLRTIRVYTDHELGYVQETLDRPIGEVADHLGRPRQAIDGMRRRIRSGWVRKKEYWTPEEDQVLISNVGILGGQQIADLLPGRNTRSVYDRIHSLGLKLGHWQDRNPFAVAQRRLLAKTCTHCGKLLPAKWFEPPRKGAQWGSWCKGCKNEQLPEYRQRPESKERKKLHAKYNKKAQDISLKFATKYGNVYTDADHKVLSDTTLTAFTKALILGRTYYAVAGQLNLNGYSSRKPASDPASDQWFIDNPNIDRIDEITASLREEIRESGRTLPDWDWDD